MRKNNGVSVISLVITIIVLIIIISVTLYNGTREYDQSITTMAAQRLQVISDSLIAYEDELNFATRFSGDKFIQITTDDYLAMGIQDYANTEKYAPVLVRKSVDAQDPYKKIYELKTPKQIKKEGVYKEEEYVTYIKEFYEEKITEHLKVEFDYAKGVNRPIFTSDMVPVKATFIGNDDTMPIVVKDIYKEDWYNYTKEAPMWANVMLDDSSNTIYVWIPRFAYKVQDFYLGMGFTDVPAAAIDVVFLKGTSDIMPNDEALPLGYQVHPAFKYKDENGVTVNLPGFWVAKRNVDFADSLITGDGIIAKEAVKLENLHPGLVSADNRIESHLIKNSEWAAVAYLSQHTVGRTTNGNSLNTSAAGIMDLDRECYVAGGLKDVVEETLPYANKYILLVEDNLITHESFEGFSGDVYSSVYNRKFGDAIVATSIGNSDHSTWFEGTSVRVSPEKPYILRGIDNNLFSYDAVQDNDGKGAYFRNVLTVRPN